MATVTELQGLREENHTLYGVIKLVSSSVELPPMLQGIVDLATEATGCHACFIYLLEDERLTIRAASKVFADAIDHVHLQLDEGLTGWVARHRTPEFIRERAMDDPRMKYVALLQEERFQSMVAVPILARSGETLGVIVLHTEAPREFTEDTLKLLVHIASLVSGAIENAQLYEQVTNTNTVKDLFEALAAGATAFAVAKAAEVRCDLTSPYLMVCAEPAGEREPSSVEWREAAEEVGRGLSAMHPRAAVEAGPGPVRAAMPLGVGRPERVEELLHACRELGSRTRAAIGVSQMRSVAAEASRAYREALDAATIGRALLREGGAIAYPQLGAYRYLVHIAADDAPRDPMRAAVDTLIAYDRRRRSSLLDTLERYLAERRSVIESSRALFIHPNTLRQRLARIEELTGVELDQADLLSLELAIKLARLHGRPHANTVSRETLEL